MSAPVVQRTGLFNAVALLGVLASLGCAPEPPAAAPPLGRLRVLQCEFDQGPLFDDSPPFQWRMLISQDGIARLSDYEAGALREREAECSQATFQQLAEALEAAQFTSLHAEYLPTPSDGFHPPCWGITATTSTGEWSVLAFTERPPSGVVVLQKALSAFKRTAQWRDA